MNNNITTSSLCEQIGSAQTLSELVEFQKDYIKMCSNYTEFYTTIYLDTIQNNFKRMLSYFDVK